jgi:hypothetical protein
VQGHFIRGQNLLFLNIMRKTDLLINRWGYAGKGAQPGLDKIICIKEELQNIYRILIYY